NTTRPAQHFLEVICVFDWLKEKYPRAKITVMGTSYGGFLAVQLTKYRMFENLILRAPAIYRPQDFYTLNGVLDSSEGRAATRVFRQDANELSKHPLLSRASNFTGRTLVIVHENDEQIPKQTTDAYITAFHADGYVAKGFHHSIVDEPKDEIIAYQNAISDWLLSGNAL